MIGGVVYAGMKPYSFASIADFLLLSSIVYKGIQLFSQRHWAFSTGGWEMTDREAGALHRSCLDGSMV